MEVQVVFNEVHLAARDAGRHALHNRVGRGQALGIQHVDQARERDVVHVDCLARLSGAALLKKLAERHVVSCHLAGAEAVHPLGIIVLAGLLKGVTAVSACCNGRHEL